MNPLTFVIELCRKFWTRPHNELEQIESESKIWYQDEFPKMKVFGYPVGEKVKPVFEHWACKLFLAMFMFVAVKWLRNIMTDASNLTDNENYDDEELYN